MYQGRAAEAWVRQLKQDQAPTPVYYRVQQAIKADIESGRLGPHEAIAPERSLIQTFGVSLGTIRKAILNLVNEGYLYRVQGRGTFVAGTTLRQGSLRYYRLLRHLGDQEATLRVKLIQITKEPGDQGINPHLGLRKNQRLIRIQRIFLRDDLPAVFTDSYFSASKFATLGGLPAAKLEKETLYKITEDVFGLPTLRNEELFSAVPAQGRVAELLEVEPGSPLLRQEMLAFTYKDQPYEYRLAYLVGRDRAVFREI